jgi:serine/threonine-protein kinase
LAQDSANGQWVALKIVPLDAAAAEGSDGILRDRFMREAQAVRLLTHPDIVAVLDVGQSDDLGWVAMELVAGTNLSRYTHRGHLLPEQWVARMGGRIARALNHAHRQGVVHRDVKPSNILVDWSRDVAKLADFGVARWADHARTRSGQALGSPDYMAPEQLAGGEVGPAADIYSLGATLYELFSGRRPHTARSLGALLRAVAQEVPTDLRMLCPDLPEMLCQIVMSALEKTPARRFADAGALAIALDRSISDPPATPA